MMVIDGHSWKGQGKAKQSIYFKKRVNILHKKWESLKGIQGTKKKNFSTKKKREK